VHKESASRISHNIRRDEVMTKTKDLRLKYREARQARNDSQDNKTFDLYQTEMEKIIEQLTEGASK
jgi:hypothetical protein